MQTRDVFTDPLTSASPAVRRFVDHPYAHWVLTGPPRSGASEAVLDRLARQWQAGRDAGRTLLLAVDNRAAQAANDHIAGQPPGKLGQLRATGYNRFAQDLIERFWPLVAKQYGIDRPLPEFLPYDLAQFACLREYRENPGALRRLTIREQRLIVQLLSTMNLAAANGIALETAWSRIAAAQDLPTDHDLIRDGLALTERLRTRCLSAGVLPFDLQIQIAAELLQDEQVRDDLLARYDTLALLEIEEFVPVMVERLTGLAAEFDQALITYFPEGGIRWLLGAAGARAGKYAGRLRDLGFRTLCLRRSESRAPVTRRGSSEYLAIAATRDPWHPPPPAEGWTLAVRELPEAMCAAAAARVVELIENGTPPDQIVLIIPYINVVIASELRVHFERADVPFWVDRRWASFPDERETRVCLTALRLNAGADRNASKAEVADLIGAMLDWNPIRSHELVRRIMRGPRIQVRDQDRKTLPEDVARLIDWIDTHGSRPVDERLELLATEVFSPHESSERAELVRACYELAHLARRHREIGPQLNPEIDGSVAFFEVLASEVIAAPGIETPDGRVVLTTPYAFLTSGSAVQVQCWLDVASASWREPPLLVLSNPHAIAAGSDAPLDPAAEERLRDAILGRLIRNLAARCDGEIHAFATLIDPDGFQSDGPLLEGLRLLGVSES